MNNAILYYVHDPMCSWCFGFQPVWQQIKTAMQGKVEIINLLGGLAPDDEEPMPAEVKEYIQGCWHQIEKSIPGTTFNFDFWQTQQPKRSTYPACRAVIAAAKQGKENEESMINALQQGYYKRAMNPSLAETQIALAKETGLDVDKFEHDLQSAETHQELLRQIRQAREMGVNGFPSLVLRIGDSYRSLPRDYVNPATTIDKIKTILKNEEEVFV